MSRQAAGEWMARAIEQDLLWQQRWSTITEILRKLPQVEIE